MEPIPARKRLGAPSRRLVVLPYPHRTGAIGRVELRPLRTTGATDQCPAVGKAHDHRRLELLPDVLHDRRQEIVDPCSAGELSAEGVEGGGTHLSSS